MNVIQGWPPEAQWALWKKDPNPEFLADPRRGEVTTGVSRCGTFS